MLDAVKDFAISTGFARFAQEPLKIAMILLDEVSAKEKKTSLLYLVKAESVDDAIKRIHKFMASCVFDYDIALVTESPIIDIFGYEQKDTMVE